VEAEIEVGAPPPPPPPDIAPPPPAQTPRASPASPASPTTPKAPGRHVHFPDEADDAVEMQSPRPPPARVVPTALAGREQRVRQFEDDVMRHASGGAGSLVFLQPLVRTRRCARR
jgi:hypothetical protein